MPSPEASPIAISAEMPWHPSRTFKMNWRREPRALSAMKGLLKQSLLSHGQRGFADNDVIQDTHVNKLQSIFQATRNLDVGL